MARPAVAHSWSLSLIGLLLGALVGCGPTIRELPPDRFPDDAWRGAAVPMQVGIVEQDTLDVSRADHTDWKSIQADRRGTLFVRLRVYRHSPDGSNGHLQILNPQKVVVLAQELLPAQEAFEIEVPVVHPGVWLLGISMRKGAVSYELRADWH